MSKVYSRFITAFFCLFLGGLLVWHLLLPDRVKSETENRTLAQFPKFSWTALTDGSYTKGVESYFADQFPLRDDWTGLKARAEQALGKREFNNVYLCKDTLIAKVARPEESLVEKNLDYVRRLREKTDIPVYLGLIPSAADIWRDRLPHGAESWDQEPLLRQSDIDLKTALSDHADEPLFYRTDHHWTTRGAYYGYQTITRFLGADPLKEDNFTAEIVSNSFNGTLYSQSGIHWLTPDTIEYWVEEDGISVTSWRSGKAEPAQLYDTAYLAKKDQYSSFLVGNQPLCVIRNENCPNGGKLLLIRDSYADSLAPFLAQNFSEVHLLDLRYYRASPAQYAETNEIDNICVLYSVQNFISDHNLVLLAQ